MSARRFCERVAHEKCGRVVAYHVVDAFAGIELQREPAWIAPCVRTAALTGDRREAAQRVGLRARLEDRGPGVAAHVIGYQKVTMRTTAFGMRLPFRDPFAIEVRHLFDQIMIIEDYGTIRANGE